MLINNRLSFGTEFYDKYSFFKISEIKYISYILEAHHIHFIYNLLSKIYMNSSGIEVFLFLPLPLSHDDKCDVKYITRNS